MKRRRRSQFVFASVTAAAFLLAPPAGARQPRLAFSTTGGDAWTFLKTLEVRALRGGCETVSITSPLSTTIARPRAGRAIARVALGPGGNLVRAQCRVRGVASGGAIAQNWHVRLRATPRALINVAASDHRIILDAGMSEPAPVHAARITRYEWREKAGNPAPLAGLQQNGSRITLVAPKTDGEYRVKLRVTDAIARADESTAVFRVRNGKPEAIDLAHDHSVWIEDAVIYGVVPKLFGPHPLADVTLQLDRLSRLGVNTLWLSPITDSPPGDFGYAVTNYFRVRPSLGTAADFRQLISAAHGRGMRVILDFVPNHLSDQHPYFADAAKHGRRSPYFNFFARSNTGEAEHYFDWRNLENLNYQNEEVERLVIEAASYWVREFDVDGFRIDAAWGPRQRAPNFWPRWRAELKRINPDILLIAEASAHDPYYLDCGFDAAYDWTEQLGQWSWHDAFDQTSHVAERLRSAIAASPSPGVIRFLENNDTGERFVARHGPAFTRIAAAMLMTLPGIPALFTGEETGAVYEPYRFSGPISWTDPDKLESWYANLIALRHREPALRGKDIRWLDPAPADNVLAYIRGGGPDGGIIVVLNYGSSPARIVLGDLPSVIAGRQLEELLTRQHMAADVLQAGITVEGYGMRILKAL